ncbi:MAG: complex I subunit 5 family protein [Candidatus Hodarchaeales archaeon]
MVAVFGIEISNLPLIIFALVPLGTASLLIFLERFIKVSRMQKNIMHIIAFIGAASDLCLALLFGYSILTDGVTQYSSSLLITLGGDVVSFFFIMIFTTVHFAVTLYCINYMEQFDELPRFYALLLTVVAGLNLITLSTDFFTLFVAYEMMNLCAYAMVGFYRSKESSEASFKYLIMSSTGAILMLYGVALVYGTTGYIDFATLATLTPKNNLIFAVAGIFIILGFGVTAAMLFFNTWLPDAHPAAPPPAHAMLSGIITLGGTYGILRTLFLIVPLDSLTNVNWNMVLIFVGILTTLQGNLFALIQFLRTDPKARNLKRIFAFSTISHMGYLITGLGAGNMLGISGVLFHALSHALAKGVLFMITGFLIYSTGTYYLDKYKGLGRRDPLIGVCFVIGNFSLASIPLTSGFWSKLQIILGLFENGDPLGIFAGTTMLIFTFFAAAGYLWLIKYIVFDKSDQEQEYIDKFDEVTFNRRRSWSMKTAIVLLTIFVVLIGIFPGPVADFALRAASILFS